MSVTINGTNGLTFNDNSTQTTAATGFGFKNRIINGDMRIDQRNAGASVTPANGNYTIDRWQASLTQASRYSVQQNAGAVTPPAGFANYLGVTSLSAYSVVSSDIFSVGQAIEGFNFADLGFGTANAQTVTLSFWVRSSLTGTFGAALVNDNTATRSYPFTYTISAANTWEQKTVTIPGDTSGTWGRTNGIGARIRFGLGTGSTFTTTAGAWTAGNFWSVTGAVSVVGTNGATFYITGVQLEKGSTATSFDYRPYSTELQLAQRYCLFLGNYVAGNTLTLARGFSTGGTAGWRIGVETPVSLRAMPTLTPVNLVGWSPAVATTTLLSIGTVYSAQGNNLEFDATFANNTGSSGSGWAVQTNTGSASYLLVSAEL